MDNENRDFDTAEYDLYNTVSDESVIDAILEEAKNYSDKEKSERRAKLFSGEDAPEIFSTAKKTVKTTTTNPLDLTGEFPIKRHIDEDTTKQWKVREVKEQGAAGEQPEDMKVEATMDAARRLETPDEYEKQEEDFLNPSQNTADGEKEQDDETRGKFEKIFGVKNAAQKRNPGNELIPYEPETEVMNIPLRNGSLYDAVRNEYEEFIRKDNEENAEQIAQQEEREKQKQTVREAKRINSSVMSRLMDFFSTGEDDEVDTDGDLPEEEQEPESIADYNEKGEEKNIFEEINFRIKSTGFKTGVLLALCVISGVLALLNATKAEQLSSQIANLPMVYSIANIVIVIFALVISLSTLTNGLVPLVRFKGNSDTAVACASVMCAVQAVSAIFVSDDYFNGVYSYYTVAVLAALFANAFGKRIMVRRIKDNFKFITSRRPNFAVGYYEDEKLSKDMTSGTAARDPIIAYQSKRGFLTDFLKLSYAQDKCELVCARLAPVTLLCSLILGILYGVVKHSFFGGIAVCAVVSAVAVPVCDLLVVNLPLRRFGKELLRKKAMLSGYPAVMKFCQTNAVVVDAYELYAHGVSVQGLKTFESLREDEAFAAATAVLNEAKSPISYAFADFLKKQNEIVLPDVESWVYEENLGLVAWVNNDRVIIGSREIMRKYGISMPPAGFEAKGEDEVAFIAFSGELTAMLTLKYRPQKAMLTELQRAELNGISLLISSTDCNITQEKVAKDFDIYYRSVKILSPGHTTVARDKANENLPRSKAYLATKGNAASMLRALSGCLKLRSSFNVGIVLQVVSVVLGVLLLATLCMFSEVSFVTTAGVLIYMAFWFVAVIIAQTIHRP